MSPTDDTLRTFPRSASNTSSRTEIAGNISSSIKQKILNIFTYSVGGFCNNIGSRTRLVHIDVCKKQAGGMLARVVCEVEVTKDMLNMFEIMHGACGAYLVDICTSTSLAVLALATSSNIISVSQTLNLVYHGGARVGTKLRIVSTTITNYGRLMASRCEIYDKETERILVSGVQTKVDPGNKISINPTTKL